MFSLDQSIFRDIHVGWHSSLLDPVFWVITSMGLGYVQIVIAILFLPWRKLRSGKLSLRDMFKLADFDYFLLIFGGWAVGGLFHLILKTEFPRDRPSTLVWPDANGVPVAAQESVRFNSFPSGHTSTSFAIAFAIFFYTRGTRQSKLGWLALVWASLVGVSRIYRGVHWPTDVVGGIFVGLAAACLLMLAAGNRNR